MGKFWLIGNRCPEGGAPGGGHGGKHLPGDGPGGHRGAFKQRDALAAVVGPRPGLRLARRVAAEGRVGGACRDGRHRPGIRADDQARGALHLDLTVLLTFPVPLDVGVPDGVTVALGTGEGTGPTAEAPETP